MRAAESLGDVRAGSGRTPRALMAASRDRSQLVRIAAIESIGRVGAKGARRTVRAALNDASALVRGAAATVFGILGEERDRDVLRDGLGRERSARARVAYYAALSRWDQERSIASLAQLLKHPSYRVRCAVANAVAGLQASLDTRRALLKELRNALASERTVAVRSSLAGAIKSLLRQRDKRRV
jgi:HEAT repeat protein